MRMQKIIFCGLPISFIFVIGCQTVSVESTRKPNTANLDVASCMTKNYPEDRFENGFVVIDVLKPTSITTNAKKDKILKPIMCEEDLQLVKAKKLDAYKPLYTFIDDSRLAKEKTIKRKQMKISETPWLDQRYDVSNKQDAEIVTKLLQRYVYEGWFDKDKSVGKKEYDTHFRENSLRFWCQTPWLNITEKGREAIHGLTKEFPIRSTHVYTVPKDVELKEDAVTWGVAFFNEGICKEYNQFFKQNGSMIPQMKNASPQFVSPDGGVSFKLLFNTMPDWRNRMKGQWTADDGNLEAYNWWAHVSHARQDDGKTEKDESIRQLLNVAHVQMDIGLKDSRLIGTKEIVKNWIMTTYYFDPHYKNEFLNDMDIPETLKHMRPVGLQYGLDAGESHIFEGAKNNHIPQEIKAPLGERLPPELDQLKTRLNGPVDNIAGSCLGCHAASGLRFNTGPMSKKPPYPPMVFTSNNQYAEFQRKLLKKTNITGDFDFNMQLDKAMRNFLNSKRDKIDQIEEAQK